LTSVVPPELPMQMAVAVNTAILALWRAHVFCTEPFRVPYAGKLTAALFDKTGTLTTDQLQVVGVSSYGDDSDLTNAAAVIGVIIATSHGHRASSTVEPQAPSTARMRLRMVLAACHSLVSVNDALVGDPTEMAASRAAGWKHDAAQHRTVPAPDSPDAELIESVQVLHTYRFASQFQRMSVLVRVVPRRGGVAQLWLLGKGSPEKVRELCSDAPPAFDRTYRSMAESGHRVLALAWRRLSDAEAARVAKNAGSLARDEAERGLHFLGFVAMSCLVRKDSAAAVQLLHGGALRVAMVTGDASLTALHVARQVAIASAEQPALLLATDAAEPDSKPPHWEPAVQPAAERAAVPIAYRAADVAQLARSHVLVVSGPALRAAERVDAAGTRAAAPHVSVFARMTPSDKEMLLRWLRENGDFTLMCGDGANDVGALKQAHVGLALLSGFGTANTAGEGEKMVHEQTEEERKAAARAAAARQAERSKQWAAERAKDVAEMKELQQVYYREEYEAADARQRSVGGAQGDEERRLARHGRDAAPQRRAHAQVWRRRGGGRRNALAAQAAWMAADMGGQDDINGMPAVKLGDASVAAPFTSKLPSIRSCVDIVRQGRCTLVSTVQNQQIMSLNAMITAYSLSALAIDGVRFGEVQMIATSLLLSVAGMAFTYARPVEQLAPTQPIGSIFHPAMALSTIGQLLIHLAMMVLAIRLTRAVQTGNEVVEQPYEPEWLTAFLTAASSAPASKKFVPTLLNTVVFLVETAQQVAVMAVNYKGRPFMLASTENSPMLISLLMCGVGLFTAASERYPLFNGALRLVQLPSDEFRWQLLAILSVSVFGALLWDRLIVAIFAPSLFVRGYVDAWRALPTLGQVAHRITIWLYWTIVVILWLSLDSLLVILAGWWFWRSTAMQRYRGIEQPPQP
jgi:cation-transporting ATPase 13A1